MTKRLSDSNVEMDICVSNDQSNGNIIISEGGGGIKGTAVLDIGSHCTQASEGLAS